MTTALAALIAVVLGIVVVGGAVAAVSLREPRAAILGLLVALSGAPFLADPLPDPRSLLARVVGAMLATYLLLIAVRDDASREPDRRTSWPVTTLVATTAALSLGLAAGAAPSPAPTAPEALETRAALVLAAGTALLVLAASSIAFDRAPLRLTMGLLLAVAGLSLIAAGVAGTPNILTELCVAGLLAALAAAGSLLHRIAHRTGIQPAAR